MSVYFLIHESAKNHRTCVARVQWVSPRPGNRLLQPLSTVRGLPQLAKFRFLESIFLHRGGRAHRYFGRPFPA